MSKKQDSNPNPNGGENQRGYTPLEKGYQPSKGDNQDKSAGYQPDKQSTPPPEPPKGGSGESKSK